MINLLKMFGKGLLYVICTPFFIVALVIFGAVGLLAFIFQIFKSIIFFFTGQKFFPELEEDKELRLMQEASNKPNEPLEQNQSSIISPIYEEPQKQPEPAPVFVQRTQPEPTIEQACFEDTSSLEDMIDDEEETIPEQPKEETIEEKHTVLETNEEPEEEEESFEELETYVPRSSTYTDADDEEENDTNSGVDIDYDL